MKRSIKIILTVFLSIGFAVISYAGYLDDWTDDQICGWMDNASPPEYIVDEAIKRNLDCAPESAKKKAQEETSQKIMIFDADFSESDLDNSSVSTIEARFSEDFENGANVTDWSYKWSVKKDIDGNSIYCNEPIDRDDYTGFQFGKEHWSNYSMSLRMKFPDIEKIERKRFANIYIRINDSNEGYSLYISNYYPVTYLKIKPPEKRLGSGNVPVKRNEWFQIKLIFSGNNLKFFHDGEFIEEIKDDKRTSGFAGVGSPSTVCVDDIVVKPV